MAKDPNMDVKNTSSEVDALGRPIKMIRDSKTDKMIKVAVDSSGKHVRPAVLDEKGQIILIMKNREGELVKVAVDSNGKPLRTASANTNKRPGADQNARPVKNQQSLKQPLDPKNKIVKQAPVDANNKKQKLLKNAVLSSISSDKTVQDTVVNQSEEKNVEKAVKTAPVVEAVEKNTEVKATVSKATEEKPVEEKAIEVKTEEVKPVVNKKPENAPEAGNIKASADSNAKEQVKPEFKKNDGRENKFADKKPQNNRGDRPFEKRNDGGQDKFGEKRFDKNGNRQGKFDNHQNGDRKPFQGDRNGDRKPFQQGDRPRNFDQNGERKPFQQGDRPRNFGQNGDRKPFQGDRGQNGFGGNRNGGFGGGFGNGFGKDMMDKDADSAPRKFQSKKQSSGPKDNGLSSEIGNDINKKKRANDISNRGKDREREKKKDRNDDFEMMGKNKSKDPNRKGAFIKPVVKEEPKEDEIKTVTLPEVLTLRELADKIKQPVAGMVKKLFLEGKMYTPNQDLSFEEAEEIALSYNCIAEKEVKVNIVEELLKDIEDDESKLVKRPPVVCVMGHVDHGKTSLLDAIRTTSVTSREAGGITQHIGAYMVEAKGEKITFLDTPGHEAFTAMRLRGAKSTDIAVLVVAADDGVMPQTVEAISHAKAAGVEIIVAVNKIDKPSANVEKVMQELTEHGLIAEEWGGSTVFVPVSAHTKEGIDKLLEMILLTSDVMELKANPDRKARGIVLEAKLDKGRGPVATVLVQKGTLRVGDIVAIGSSFGKVRAMMADTGARLNVATPSTPVEILGLNAVPEAGEVFIATGSEKEAREISDAFISQSKEKLIADTKSKLSLDGLFSQIKAGNVKELNIIVKADVQGSVEAVKQSLEKLTNDEVAVRIIHGGVGAINESDVTLASASNAIIIGFNVKPDNTAKDIAERENVDLRLYKVIYNAIEDVEAAMRGMLEPIYEEKVIGHAEIRALFKASGVGVIAGSYVLDGKIVRGCKARITREGKLIYEGPLASLKRLKDDVKEVNAGYECGMVFEKFNDLAELDQVELYTMVEVPRK